MCELLVEYMDGVIYYMEAAILLVEYMDCTIYYVDGAIYYRETAIC
jgi:hypothetical protein